MTVTEEVGNDVGVNSKDVTELKFEPILNVSTIDSKDSFRINGKCSMDKDLGVLAIETSSVIAAIDINRKKEIFRESRSTDQYNLHSHNFVDIDNKKYLSVQTAGNTIKFFHIKQTDNEYKHEEDESLRICLNDKDRINCCEFDKTFENIFYVKNTRVLEKRVVNKTGKVVFSITLEQEISENNMKMMSLSNKGDWCVIAGGGEKGYFYLIDIENKIQHKLTSTQFGSSYSPCFINGDHEFVAIGGKNGKIEIWDVAKKSSIKVIEVSSTTQFVSCMNSTNNILAVGSNNKKLSLWDVKNWNMFHCEDYQMYPRSVHLTTDSKYLTIGGHAGEKCVILEIK
eukprot:117108_1